jgi:DNA-binding MarR family transcriptional regulator
MAVPVDFEITKGCYCLRARKAARAITRLYEEKLRPHGLRATQFSILAALACKGPTRIGELAEALGLERTTLTRSATLLAQKGWTADAASQDGRERLIEITASGLSKLEAALPSWEQAQAQAGGRFEAASVDT